MRLEVAEECLVLDRPLHSAILHLANAVEAPGDGVSNRCQLARDLVRDIAFPDPAEKPGPRPTPKRSIVFTRHARRRPDGAWETRDGREGPWSPVPSSTPAPSCDSPHCDCVEGGDCRANNPCDCNDADDCRIDIGSGWRPKGCKGWIDGVEEGPRPLDVSPGSVDAARTARSIAAKLRAHHAPLWTLSWKGDRFEVDDGGVTAETDVLASDATVQDSVVAINSLVRGMRLNMIAMESVVAFQDDGNGKVTPIYGDPDPAPDPAPDAPDLAARLDGLKAAVDALAERLDRKAGGGGSPYMPRPPRPVHVVAVGATVGQGSQLGDVWWIKSHPAVAVGALVCEGEGGDPMEVVDFHELGGGKLSVVVRPAKEG